MTGMPLHPALVHLPLGLAVVAPLLSGLWLWRSLRRPEGGDRLWLAALLTQAVLVAGAVGALLSGEGDEEVVESVVAEAAIEAHELLGTAFLWSAVAVLAVMLGARLFARRRVVGQALLAVATLGAVAVAGLGLATGHAGGELVYVHGAASAHDGSAAGGGGSGASAAPGERGEAEEDEED